MLHFLVIKKKINRRKVFLGLVIASSMLLAAEIIGHIAYYYLHDGISLMKMRAGHETRFSPYGLYKFSPNIKTTYDGLETDRFGFIHNGREEPIKEEDYTIFILGGSTVAGLGCSSNEHTIAAQIEKKLRQKKDLFESVRVINAGTSAYVSHQERMRVDEILGLHSPDMIIALDGFNDAFFVSTWAGRGWRPYWQPEYTARTREIREALEGVPLHIRIKETLRKKSIIYNTLLYILAPNTSRNPGASNFSNRNTPDEATIKRAVSVYKNNHVLIREICNLHGVDYMGLLQPALTTSLLKPHKSSGENEIIKRWKANFLKPKLYYPSIEDFYRESSGITGDYSWFFDLSRIFSEHKETLYVDTCHYNDRANEIIAGRIAELIEINKRGKTAHE